MLHYGFKLLKQAAMVTAFVGLSVSSVQADDHVTMVDGAKMYADRTIVENASNADSLSTLVAAVKAADLVETLSSEGPFTVFAPTNDAFAKLPDGTVDTLLEPENKGKLQSILTYHVVPAKATASAVVGMIEDGGGEADVTTVEGGTLTLMLEGDSVIVEDAQGNLATVTKADVMQSNGVVHVIDTVLMP
jgi:uncharacterized surface protein with fasciclin (FAS1) repeats